MYHSRNKYILLCLGGREGKGNARWSKIRFNAININIYMYFIYNPGAINYILASQSMHDTFDLDHVLL